MNQYVTGAFIKKLREERKMTQAQLAQRLYISEKAVSKWETGKGFPDISLIDSLADALSVSVIELVSGNDIKNVNRSFNMKKVKLYVCPICSNIIWSTGDAVVSCCGVTLPALEAEDADDEHSINIESVEDEYYVTLSHEMTKSHYISFIANVNDSGCEIVKLYPESDAEARFKKRRACKLYYYCNKHGLFCAPLK
ncbi:MAG: helix-turn-helix domain-containing protein [Eubacterium sp.]